MNLEFPQIQDDDIPYEKEILKSPNSLSPWLRYIEFTSERSLENRIFIFDRACNELRRSYKIWKMYLDLRVDYLEKLNSRLYVGDGAVDSSQLIKEVNKVDKLYKKCLSLLGKMPRLWEDYLNFLLIWKPFRISEIRRCFDKALQSLPVTQHDRIWPLYIRFSKGLFTCPKTVESIWCRYILFAPEEIENCISVLIDLGCYEKACELLIGLLNNPKYISVNGKTRYQLWEELADLLVRYSMNWSVDSAFVERVLRSGMKKYSDQMGKLCVQLATFWINMKDYEKARDVFEEGLENVTTVRDFSQIFDSYSEFEESLIGELMDGGGNGEDEDGSIMNNNDDIDRLMESFEQLMDRRPFILNNVLLRQNPNNVIEWEKRIALWGNDLNEVVKAYEKAIETINPKKCVGKLYQLWSNYAKLYEKNNDISTARIIFDKATKVPYKSVNELCDVWIEWAEMELRLENFDNAIKVMETAVNGPKISKIDYFDETKSPQERLHKSMKLWSFYIDLVESIGTLEEVKPLYDRVFELKIGTTLTIINYANLLEENEYFEESFKIYERGIELFSYPIAFEIWNIYLQKAIKRGLGIERLRDLFEQALEGCPNDLSKSLYMLYGKLEEEKGLLSNAVKIYSKAATSVDDKDKLEMYRFYIARVAENFGLPGTRSIFEKAIDELNNKDANIIGQEFIQVEEKLGEIDRVRVLYGFLSQFNNPKTNEQFWKKWDTFEIKHGNEETYKEMLRIKRSIITQFNTELNYIASEANIMNQLEKQTTTTTPVGFVQSEKSNSQTPYETDTVENPDEIDIEID